MPMTRTTSASAGARRSIRAARVLPNTRDTTVRSSVSVAARAAERAHGGAPRRPRIRCGDEVEVDRQARQGSEARLAVTENRLRAPVGDPRAAGPRHAALRDYPGALVRAAAAKRAREQALVVSV